MHLYTLRPAREADFPFLRALRAQSMREHLENSGLAYDEAAQAARILDRYDCARIVVCDGADVGLFKVCREGSPWELIQIQLLPAVQGRGLGAALIRDLLADAAAAAAGVAVELSVLKANPAQRLYARLGFRPVGEEARAYTLRWTPPRAAKA